MRIAGVDLGTKTGYALSVGGMLQQCGTWTLAKPKEITYMRRLRMDRRCDPRFLVLCGFLLNVAERLDWIIFEDVQFSSTTMQTQLWSGLRSAVWMMARQGVNIDCVPVGTLKKFATGNGAADKPAMARALAKQDPRFRLDKGEIYDTLTSAKLDDNAVDAIFLVKWGQKNFH